MSARLIVAVLACTFCAFQAVAGSADADGFFVEVYTEGLNQPIALAWAPDGRLFVAEREGAIRIIDDGVLLDEPFVETGAFSEGECGALGLALSPNFANDRFVYAFVTTSEKEQRILRWTDNQNVGENETIIRGNLPTSGTVHNGGCLRFAPDGLLYFSVGDIGTPENSQDIQSLAGKLSRINPDGSVPADNPFETPTGAKRATFASGFRNPFRFCFSPDGRLFVMDVGSSGDNQREEINLVRSGLNYGWPEVEGTSETAAADGFTNPLLAYHDQGSSISGCVFYSDSLYPEEYEGNLFHIDYVSKAIFRAVLTGDEIVSHEYFIGLDNGPVDLALGNDGNLYYSELFSGRIMRVRTTNPQEDRPTADLDLEPDESSGASNSIRGMCGVGMVHTMITAMMMMAAIAHRRRSTTNPRRRS
ncbi:MAG: PQQ-dependent sugar dehydrogenase [Phycisphaerae bacterium]|nr:PQQ-dependent sugar dehydrogenase [Phycisphaerales bacterium]